MMVHATQLSSLVLVIVLLAIVVVIVRGSTAIVALVKLGRAHLRWHSTIAVVSVRH